MFTKSKSSRRGWKGPCIKHEIIPCTNTDTVKVAVLLPSEVFSFGRTCGAGLQQPGLCRSCSLMRQTGKFNTTKILHMSGAQLWKGDCSPSQQDTQLCRSPLPVIQGSQKNISALTTPKLNPSPGTASQVTAQGEVLTVPSQCSSALQDGQLWNKPARQSLLGPAPWNFSVQLQDSSVSLWTTSNILLQMS